MAQRKLLQSLRKIGARLLSSFDSL